MNDRRPDHSAESELGRRLDRLARVATAEVRLHPAGVGRRSPRTPWVLVAAVSLLVAVGAGLLWRATSDGSGDGAVVVTDDPDSTDTDREPAPDGTDTDGEPAPDGTDTDGEPATDGTAPDAATVACTGDDPTPVLDRLRAGLPTYDYEPAGSFAALAERATVVITGTLTAAVREVPADDRSGEGYTVASVTDVTVVAGQLDGTVDEIAYTSFWPDGAGDDPLADPVSFDDVTVVAFLTPWSGVRSGWTPGVEGLYVSCGLDTAVAAVIESAAGADDPAAPTPAELIDAATAAPDAGADEAARRAAAEAYATALAEFASGEALAIEEIPLAAEVALVLGPDIEATRTNVEMRDPAAWTVERDEFRAYAGPFSVLDHLAGRPDVDVTVGAHRRCVADPTPPPTGFDDRIQLSIQPAEGTIDSCLQWFAVDLYVDPATLTIEAIVLDLYEP